MTETPELRVANRDDLERLAGRALFDETFRKDLLDKPAETAKKLGLKLEQKHLDRLAQVDRNPLETWVKQLYTIGGFNERWFW